MKKKIIIISILAALMLLSTPVISSIQLKDTESIPVRKCELCACNAGGLRAFICGALLGQALLIIGYITPPNNLDEAQVEKLTKTLEVILGIMILLGCSKEFFPDVSKIENIDTNIEINLISKSTSNGYSYTAMFPLDQEIIDNLRNTLQKEYSKDVDVTFTYNFDFGDGNIKTIENVKDTSYTMTHTYKNKGKYTVKASITMIISGDGESYSLIKNAEKTIPYNKNKTLLSIFDFPLFARLSAFLNKLSVVQ